MVKCNQGKQGVEMLRITGNKLSSRRRGTSGQIILYLKIISISFRSRRKLVLTCWFNRTKLVSDCVLWSEENKKFIRLQQTILTSLVITTQDLLLLLKSVQGESSLSLSFKVQIKSHLIRNHIQTQTLYIVWKRVRPNESRQQIGFRLRSHFFQLVCISNIFI